MTATLSELLTPTAMTAPSRPMSADPIQAARRGEHFDHSAILARLAKAKADHEAFRPDLARRAEQANSAARKARAVIDADPTAWVTAFTAGRLTPS